MIEMNEEQIYGECVPFGLEDWNRSVKVLRGYAKLRQEMYGTFVGPTPEQEREAAIAREYHESCDAYDERLPGISPRIRAGHEKVDLYTSIILRLFASLFID
jgi:hypothetical protein